MSDDELDPEQLARDSADFSRRVIDLAPGRKLSLDADAWRDAIIFLTAGEVEFVCDEGERRRFARGAMLCLAPTASVLRNCGGEPARLIAISRRTG